MDHGLYVLDGASWGIFDMNTHERIRMPLSFLVAQGDIESSYERSPTPPNDIDRDSNYDQPENPIEQVFAC